MSTQPLTLREKQLETYLKNRLRTPETTLFEGEVLVEESLFEEYQEQERPKDLLDLVNVIEVLTPQGLYQVTDFGAETLDLITLDDDFSPGRASELLKATQKVRYNAKLFAGKVKFSGEDMEDNQLAFTPFLLPRIIKMIRRTKNKEIGKVLQTATPQTASTLDNLKDIVALFNPEREISIVVTQSLFNTLEKLKDNSGRPLLKVDKKTGTSETLYIDHFLVVDDTTLGNKGDKLAFIGDLKNFVTLFDRAKTTLTWVDFKNTFTEQLVTKTQFDVQKIISEVGYLVTWN